MKIVLMGLLCIMLSACDAMDIEPKEKASAVEQNELDKNFNDMRQNTPKLISVLNKFPKGGDLHNHASGAAYIEYAIIFAIENDYYFDLDKQMIVNSPVDAKLATKIEVAKRSEPSKASESSMTSETSKTSEPSKASTSAKTIIKVADLIKNSKEYQAFIDIVSSRGWHRNTANGSDHFFEAFAHAGAPDYYEEYYARIIARNYSQNVKYLELMTSVVPPELINKLKSQLSNEDFNSSTYEKSYARIEGYLKSDEFSNTIKSVLDIRRNELDTMLRTEYNITFTGDNPDIIVRYITGLRRTGTNYDFFIRAAAYMQVDMLSPEVFGPTMLENEADIASLMNFDAQMAILSLLFKENDNKPKMSIHAGELVLRESPLEPMRDRISRTITEGKALRIGHGIAIGWESDVTKTLELMRKNGIAVEICLTSNDTILGVAGKDHPLSLYLEANVPVTIATDDEGISRSNLTMEYVRAAQEHNLSYSQLKQISKNALKYSFLDGEGIYDKAGNVHVDYQRYIYDTNMNISLSAYGPKVYLQLVHERDLAAFEKEYLSN